MKSLLLTLLFLPAFVSAEALLVSSKVLDRASNGSAIRELYIYPSAVLVAGEKGSIHIGPTLRFPVGEQRVDLGEGVSKVETVYEAVPVGLFFEMTYLLDGGVISYSAKATSKMSLGVDGQTSQIRSTETYFYGKTELGGLVEVQFEGPDGHTETLSLHFGPAPDEV